MIVKEVCLRNFKSHRNTRIGFEKGINLIAGRNGAGKSSILEAILVALYGVRGGARKSDLLHVGAEEYSIEIIFELHGKEYRILRKSNGNSELLGEVRIEGDQRINEWVEKNISPFHVFTGAVYVRQGEIETIISDEAGREKIIRKITRIEDYENAWKNLGAVIRELENEMKRYAELLKQKEECEKRLKEKSSEIAEIEKEIKRSDGRLKELGSEIARILEEKKVYDELKGEKDRLSFELVKLEGEKRGLKEKAESLSRQKAEVEQKIASLSENLKKLENVEKMAKRYSELSDFYREFLKAIQEIEAKLMDLEVEKERLGLELKKCREKKEEVEKIRAEIAEIEKKLEHLSANAENWQKVRQKIERQAQIERTLSEKNLSPEKVEIAFSKIQKARELDKALKEEFERLSTRKGSLIAEEKRLSEVIENLRLASGSCPICGRELTEEHRKELLRRYSEDLKELKEKLREIGEREGKLREERRKVEEALAKQDSVLKFKQLVDELKKISEEIKTIDVERLKSSSEEFEKMKNRRDFLRENEAKALEASQKLEEIAKKVESVEQRYSETQMRKRELLSRLSEKGFSSIEALEEEIGRLKESYEEWIGLKKAKEELEDAELKLKTLKEEIESVSKELGLREGEIEKRKRILEEIEKKYKEEKHAELEKREREVSKEIAGLEERLSVLKKSIEGLKADRDYLQKQLEMIREAERKAKIIEKAIPELEKIREKFASYKNIVAEAALKEVEKYASEIFEEFTEGKYSGIKLKRVFEYGRERLKIFVIHQGSERETSFLSGGELVALGIAFRLALSMFEAKGRIPLLIMDEPTPFLDEERRRKLVDITLNYLRRIPQVIIVSHDEELKDAADKVIALEYRGGVSFVASQ